MVLPRKVSESLGIGYVNGMRMTWKILFDKKRGDM